MIDHNWEEPQRPPLASEDDVDRAFTELIARPLRAREALDPSFEERVMSAVQPSPHGMRVISDAPWYRRRLEMHPVTVLAMAAAVAAVAFFGARQLQPPAAPQVRVAAQAVAVPSPVTRHPQPDTVYLVRFVFVDSSRAAHSVALVGDFNAWRLGSSKLAETGVPGVWTASVPLAPGRHEYAFVVDGKRWVADPTATTRHDDFGTESSVMTVAPPSSSTGAARSNAI